jgi:hypothetical protein
MPELLILDSTPEEKKLIKRLDRIAKDWPDSLWLMADENGKLLVMRKLPNGERAFTRSGHPDPNYTLASIDIETDGAMF